jgi:predicted ABC-type exoprotein transport system permease subunit
MRRENEQQTVLRRVKLFSRFEDLKSKIKMGNYLTFRLCPIAMQKFLTFAISLYLQTNLTAETVLGDCLVSSLEARD